MDLEDSLRDIEDDSPQAFRQVEADDRLSLLETEDNDIEETLLQAVLHNQGYDDKYEAELQAVIALSLKEAHNIVPSNTGDSGNSQGISDLVDGPTRPQNQSLSASAGIPSIRLREQEIVTMSAQGGGNPQREESEYAEELKALLKSGVLKPDQLSEDLRRKIGHGVPRGASSEDIHPEVGASANTVDIANDELGIADIKPDALSSGKFLKDFTLGSVEPGSAQYKLIILDSSSKEYMAVKNDFRRAGLIIYNIERLQNKYLLDKFKSEQENIIQHRSQDFELNERYLYHGTSAVKDRICEEGLDARLSRMGSFGKGIYFSDNPSKCIQYTGRNGEFENILMCRVLLGDSKVYAPKKIDPDLRREPEKETGVKGWRYFDSVAGQPIDYNEFVVYENRRAMIEYFITYKVDTGATPSSLERPLLPQQVSSDFTEERHLEIIEKVRDSVRKKRCQEKGETYETPSETARLEERMKWRSILKTSGVQSEQLYAGQKADDPTVSAVMDSLMTDFLNVTQSDDRQKAKKLIHASGMDLNAAIEAYYSALKI